MSNKSPGQNKISVHAEARRRRLLYSLNDLQQALSACDFLYECEETGTYSKIELRRFRCYETTLVVAYTRPFSQSRGESAPLTMRMVGLKLSKDRLALHDKLMDMRNKIMAHSDSDMMRLTTQPFGVSMREGEPPMYLIQTVFDEGITLHGNILIEANELLHQVYQAISTTLHDELQANPELFNLRVDSDAARAARNMSG
jgi:hypothetical protein